MTEGGEAPPAVADADRDRVAGAGSHGAAAAPSSAAANAARIAWFATFGAETPRDRAAPSPALPPPRTIRAERGRGHVTVHWEPVEGAAGYLVYRGASRDGPFQVVDQRAGDVLAVPHGPYLDTTGVGSEAWYAVAAIPDVDADRPERSDPVPVVDGVASGYVEIRVDARDRRGSVARPWRPIVGSEHLALLLRGAGPGGHPVGDELAEAFRIVRRELGAETVRAHGLLHDSLGVYREADGRAVHDFATVDDVLDRLLATGLRPIVELSFMPAALARDPSRTVFAWRGVISPPRDDARWASLVRDLVGHLADRYGREEVARWAFEVWNEPNLQLFWAGAESEYLHLYEAAAAAVKSVDARFRVGGPATSAAAWVADLLAHCRRRAVPIDFVSTHTYGLPPIDLRPVTARAGRPDLPLWWTEWGVAPAHADLLNDGPWAAPLVARGLRSAAGRLGALAYWVASDHFDELGAPERLFHGGFGLLTVGNLRKPRFWAIAILERLGADELGCVVTGDGGGSLVEAWASRDEDGRIAVAAWNGTYDQARAGGDPALDRAVSLAVDGIGDGSVEVRHRRVDADHSNITRTWERLGRPDWPDAAGWDALRAADRLEDLEPPRLVRAQGGRVVLEFALPMPSVSLVELVPAP